ncbi:uncharacterized protein LOC130448617 [Diorhabda sublineata]|uniref:uncharacterized protein LOC130448617 n=1 Tax=Diorhabda sublineata TaxID=1163346 RepID=UPI0024E0C265|nr:uncharacterized protein LOC130448617 [Diorhabda sublineata]
MEVDIDIDDINFGDKIKEFLEHKLNEIKNINLSREEKIKERKQYLKEILQVNGNSEKIPCLITVNWKKYFNNKFVICYSVYGNDKTSLGKFELFLNTSLTSNYKYLFYSKRGVSCKNEIKCEKITDDLEKINFVFSSSSETYLVVVIDDINFLDNLVYDIIGKLLISNGNKDVLIDLPEVKISPEDYTSNEVSDVSLTTGKLDNILAVLSTTEKIELMLFFPENWNVNLDSTFEIHCSLTKLQLRCNCKSYFAANRLSQAFVNTILELHSIRTVEEMSAVVHFISNDGMLSFLHHVHKQIPGLTIIPMIFYRHYKIRDCNVERRSEILRRFQNSVNREIELLESLGGNSKSAAKYRSKLINTEKETDILYLKLCQINNY